MARTKFLVFALLVSALALLLSLACDDLVTETIETTIAGHPIAEFGLASGQEFDSGCVPFEVAFRDLSSGPINKWTWAFGDGDSANDTNPTHTYDSAGLFTVALRVEDTTTGGVDTEVKKRYIKVGTVVADFVSEDTLACVGNPVEFQIDGAGGLTALTWHFGDDSILNVAANELDSPVVHHYHAPGSYSVTISATGACGQKDFTKEDYIRVVQCPQAVIAVFQDRGCVPFKAHFADTLSVIPDGEVVSTRSWSFGNNFSSLKAIDSTTYNEADTFEVRLVLTATNGGYDTAYDTVIAIAATDAAFTTLSPTTGCLVPGRQFQVKFQDQSAGELDSLLWEFGDGDTAWNNPTPIHAYDEGYYSVILKAYGECGADSVTKQDLVLVSASFTGPAGFAIWDSVGGLVLDDTTTAISSGNPYYMFDNSPPSAIKRWYWFTTGIENDEDSLLRLFVDDTSSVDIVTAAMSVANECDSMTTAVKTLTVIHPEPPTE